MKNQNAVFQVNASERHLMTSSEIRCCVACDFNDFALVVGASITLVVYMGSKESHHLPIESPCLLTLHGLHGQIGSNVDVW